MTDPTPNSQRRYRRRIVGWGLFLLVVAFVIPAIFIVRWVHSDLENRVEQSLVASGIEGVTADFSGQDGTLVCDDPLDDADSVVTIAADVYGVNAIDLDRSCLGRASASAVQDPPVSDTAVTDPPSTDTTTTVPSTTQPATSVAPPSTEPDIETVAELAAADPQFSQLASLLDTADLVETLDGDGPFTLLAPTDAAFDAAFEAVGADAFESLASDPERLRTVLLHHVTDGLVLSTDFETGPLTMLDDTSIEVDASAVPSLTFTSGDAVANANDTAQLDIEASNGVIHAIDQVLLPADFSIEEPVAPSTTSATLENGQITLTGTVQSGAQRDALIARAQEQVADGNVIDELIVDDAAVVSDANIDRLGQLAAVLPPNLVSGVAVLTGDDLTVTGVHTGDDAAATLEALVTDLDAVATLEARANADAESAQQLQDELNEFVRLNPILFEPNSAELTAEADSVVEQVAARAQRFDGVAITIIGHTDSDGDEAGNLALSDGRAGTVLTELVALGVDAETLTSEGRGQSELILDEAGVEDKDASRRVEFVVEARA